jgi:hypothetical protein
LAQHRIEQDARNMVEAEMTAGQRMLVSLGGIMYNGYQSVKSGVVGVKDLAVSAYEWDQRVIGDLLHGDVRAAAAEYAGVVGIGIEKADALLTGAQNLGIVLADPESRQMVMEFVQEYYGTSSQVTQSELLGKLPMELLIAAGTAGAGEVVSAAGIPQKIGAALNSLADALRAVEVRSPLIPVGPGELGSLGVKGVRSPFVRTSPPEPPTPEFPPGSFSVVDWGKYPTVGGVPKPEGAVFRLLEDPEYQDALKAKDAANNAMHKADPSLKGLDIHEIHPVKLGGSPTDIANKIPLTRAEHSPYTTWWRDLQRYIERANKD